uniref:FtsK/SpoIIIE domain-containing protein n=2 Tax=Anaerostipes TaxID=207244 RepID=UPI000AD6C475|nr:MULTISPECIES: FtsK/SpoIIIE domain-containing protein [Anaerostipes]
MRFFAKGKRIRIRDKNLIFSFVFFLLSPIFLSVFLLLNWWQISDFSGISLHNLDQIKWNINFPFVLFSFCVTVLVCVAVAWSYHYFRIDQWKQRVHRQEIARMLLQNGWYESEAVQSQDSFFKDLPGGSKSKEKITYFPKVYYTLDNGIIRINVRITMGKYQDQLLHLEKKLETGLFCELIVKELKESYVEYELLYDTIGSRISIEEMEISNGCLKLMDNVYWEYDTLPHMLIAGATGGGKTYFLLCIIWMLLHTNAVLTILDPKNADLADLETVLPDVHHRKEEMISCIEHFCDEMLERNEAMKRMPGYKTGENYAYLGLEPHFLVFDEYVAFMNLLGNKASMPVMEKLNQIAMLGRQSGYFIILACQRPDAKYLQDGMRDQFNFRVALGRMSELGYSMMFGEQDKDFFFKRTKGRGYVDAGNGVISEFYTPLVPKGYDFLREIGKLQRQRVGQHKERIEE